MSTTGLPVFDTTVQESNLWLKAVMEHLHTDDRHLAYLALRGTLHALRDRIGAESAVHLAAQLPMLLRGLYYEGWRMAASQTKERSRAEFFDHVRSEFPPDSAIDPNVAARSVFAVMRDKLDPGEVHKVIDRLPAELRELGTERDPPPSDWRSGERPSAPQAWDSPIRPDQPAMAGEASLMLIFALNATRDLGTAVARALGLELAPHEEREFEDGEHKARPLISVRGRDVYVVQSLHGGPEASPNDKLCRLLFFAGALRDAGAARVTAVVPYLAYARKDRRTQLRDPITTRYVAQLIEAVGVDRVVTVDVHNLAAFENAFRCPTMHLEARPLFVAHLLPLLREREMAVVSPDAGGVKRAELFRESLARRSGPKCRWPSWRSDEAAAWSAAKTRWSVASRVAPR